jgi:hypothetical protein
MKSIIIVGPFIWIIIHYTVPWVYVKFCTPAGFIGFLESILLTNTPHCEALRYTLTLSSFNIKCMWIFWGASILGYLTKNFAVNNPNSKI